MVTHSHLQLLKHGWQYKHLVCGVCSGVNKGKLKISVDSSNKQCLPQRPRFSFLIQTNQFTTESHGYIATNSQAFQRCPLSCNDSRRNTDIVNNLTWPVPSIRKTAQGAYSNRMIKSQTAAPVSTAFLQISIWRIRATSLFCGVFVYQARHFFARCIPSCQENFVNFSEPWRIHEPAFMSLY